MKASEAMQILGLKLEEKYNDLGFKYKKSNRSLTKNSKKFIYMIVFSSFSGNTKDDISIEVAYIVNERYGDGQILYHSLRNDRIYLNIANEEKIEETFPVVCEWMEKILIPKIVELE